MDVDFGSDHHRFLMQGSVDKLKLYLQVALQEWSKLSTVKAYKIENEEGKTPRFILYWGTDPALTDLIPTFNWDVESTAVVVGAWLRQLDKSLLPHEPDTDGSTAVGVRIYNEKWGAVGGSFYGIAAIEPHWLEYGK